MKIKISYHSIQSDHILATPAFTHFEIVEAESLDDPKLVNHITNQKDWDGHKFDTPTSRKEAFGFDYTSNRGGVTAEKYKEPKVRKL